MSDKAEKLNKLLELLGGDSLKSDSLSELYAAVTSRKNKEDALPFSRIPYDDRIVLLPQCLRSTEKCKAEERAAEYICKKCRSCKIADILDYAEKLGYMDVRIVKGGRAVARLLKELKPKAVLGVACNFEGTLGVPLLRDGCADTDVDLDEVFEAMEFIQL